MKNKNLHKTKLVKCELFWYPITFWKDIICVRFYLGRGTLFHYLKKNIIQYIPFSRRDFTSFHKYCQYRNIHYSLQED